MTLSRRSVLHGGAIGAAVALFAPRFAFARGLLTDATLDDVLKRGLAAATKAGASYADVRIVRFRRESVATREERIEHVGSSEDYGVGVRVIAKGAWGYAAAPVVNVTSVEDLAKQAVAIAVATAPSRSRPVALAPVAANVDVWQTPLTKDPFKIPLEDKAALLIAINQAAMRQKGIKFASARYAAASEWKLMASTDGAYTEQTMVRLGPTFSVTAIDDKRGEFATRAHDLAPRQAGWEYVEAANLVADAPRIAAEAVEKLAAPTVTAGKRDLVLAPSNLWLVIHESIGHSTELDRAMGYEANFAGTSFATPDKRGTLKMGAPILTFYADKTTPGGLATCGYDDDGVATQRWNLVDKGTFVGYQTTRDQAAWIGETSSRGCSYGEGYAGVPFQRMPNVSLAPHAAERSLDDLVAATDDGVLVVGQGSWSIDHQRLNFQFGGQTFYDIRGGKRRGMLKDVAYQANTLEFWRACDLIGGPKSWELHGSLSDGKGEPSQSNAVSHGCPPVRIRKASIISTNRRGGQP